MDATQFIAYAREIPYNPRHENASGLLAPLVRSMGHILFLMACVASEKEGEPPIMTPEEKQNELTHAKDHIPPLTEITESTALSNAAKAHIVNYAALIASLHTDWAGWEHDSQVETLRATTNAAAALAAFFDRELAGFRSDQSDPGISL